MTPFIIAQLSDLHCGSPFFVPSLLERAIVEINELGPDVWWSRAISPGTACGRSTSRRATTWTAWPASG